MKELLHNTAPPSFLNAREEPASTHNNSSLAADFGSGKGAELRSTALALNSFPLIWWLRLTGESLTASPFCHF